MRKARVTPIVPIILAAGKPASLPIHPALALFGVHTALSIAVRNCRSALRAKPIVVLGAEGAYIRDFVPPGARVAVNRRWRSGMLSSIRAAMGRVPRRAAILLYPVDLPLLTPQILRRLAAAWHHRGAGMAIVSPVHRGRAGHPVILAPELRSELLRARTAREVVERDRRRVALVSISSAAIYQDFATLAEYAHCVKLFGAARETMARSTG